jgi:hypothetical protein
MEQKTFDELKEYIETNYNIIKILLFQVAKQRV